MFKSKVFKTRGEAESFAKELEESYSFIVLSIEVESLTYWDEITCHGKWVVTWKENVDE